MTLTQELLQLNITDYIIVAVIVVSTFISLIRGFLKELISLVIWALGFWVAIKFHDDFSAILAPYIANISIRLIASFSGLFLIVLILGAIFSRLLSFIIVKSGLSGFDRLLGMIFGLTRGVLLIAVILLLISTTSFVQDDWWKQSILIPHLQVIVDWLRIFLPQKITNLASVIN
ncbi:MAG: CvpA family protein [uncultured bacterium]|nr:MAG: CvpA family protein [uncultured bacterium]